MFAPTRLFDLPEYQFRQFPREDMLACKENGIWKKYSTAEVIRITRLFSLGLLQLGISGNDLLAVHQDKVAIISNNRPEWIFTDLATQQVGAVLVPIYPTISQYELGFILKEAEVKILFVSDENLYQKVQVVRSSVPSLSEVFSFNPVSGVRNWSEVLDLARESDGPKLDQIKESIRPEHLADIIYTSGTTGDPKGVMLSHHNILSNVKASLPCVPIDQYSRILSFLPLNHSYERLNAYFDMYGGASIYYAESIDAIGANLKEVRPTLFATVPRLLEKMYERITVTGLGLTGIKRALFFWALELGKEYEINTPKSLWYRIQLGLANRLVFSKWREALGGRVVAIITGSAPCQVRLLRVFTAAGIPILEGYGLTETSPVISVNRMDPRDRKFGTVGPLIPGVSVRIAEDGEILCKGPNIMMGYYKRPDLTAEVMEGDWLHTGDIGLLEDGKFLKITDRKKELFKTSGGKYVAPQPLENKMKESPFIEQIMVVGDGRKFISALIVPSFHNLKSWCEKNRVSFTTQDELVKNPRILELFKSTVEKYNGFFGHTEQIKEFELLPHEWTIEGGELTPTLKVKRKFILSKNEELIDRIYAQNPNFAPSKH